ncbi:general stress protein [Kocuria sp. SM24M-10]|uniref:general stress protein n=1 Tax=Kocuria sp. SM24M-10 TaxID=1660349 RepID=UPI00069A5DC5|nr:general stress protein [Kocuria sp. SM24M-10]
MSTPRSLPPASPAVRGLPRGEVIGRYGTYADAQKAVDHLADEQFEVDRIAIVGNDLKSVEQVTGRLSYPKVAGQGALNGMVFGAFLGMILSLLGGGEWVSSLLVSVLLGGAFWMLLATVTYAMQRGKRDFTSTNQIVATSYDVVAAPEVAQRARQVLQGLRGLQSLPLGGSSRPGPAQAPAHGQGGPVHGQGPAHGQQPPGPGAPWQRPAYGAPTGQGAGPQTPGQQGPGQQGPAGPAPGQRPEEPVPGRSAGFEDLPDGRPQYGIRLPAGEPARRDAGPAEHGAAPEKGPEDGPGEPSAGGSTSADASR